MMFTLSNGAKGVSQWSYICRQALDSIVYNRAAIESPAVFHPDQTALGNRVSVFGNIQYL
jgi:hypothetical protein